MKNRSIMAMGDFRLLPKGLRRMLVVSEDFFFREAGKTEKPKKNRREVVREDASSLVLSA